MLIITLSDVPTSNYIFQTQTLHANICYDNPPFGSWKLDNQNMTEV